MSKELEGKKWKIWRNIKHNKGCKYSNSFGDYSTSDLPCTCGAVDKAKAEINAIKDD